MTSPCTGRRENIWGMKSPNTHTINQNVLNVIFSKLRKFRVTAYWNFIQFLYIALTLMMQSNRFDPPAAQHSPSPWPIKHLGQASYHRYRPIETNYCMKRWKLFAVATPPSSAPTRSRQKMPPPPPARKRLPVWSTPRHRNSYQPPLFSGIGSQGGASCRLQCSAQCIIIYPRWVWSRRPRMTSLLPQKPRWHAAPLAASTGWRRVSTR